MVICDTFPRDLFFVDYVDELCVFARVTRLCPMRIGLAKSRGVLSASLVASLGWESSWSRVGLDFSGGLLRLTSGERRCSFWF